MADGPDRSTRRAEVPLPPMPAAWREEPDVMGRPGPHPPSLRHPPLPAPPRPPVAKPRPPAPPRMYGPPQPYAAGPIPGGSPTRAVYLPPPYPAPIATAMPVSAPRPRPVSPIPYPGLPLSAPPMGPASGPVGYGHPAEPMSDRSSVVAGVLQLVLGAVGAGRIYTGHIAIAFAQLSIVWFAFGLTVCFGLGFSTDAVWPLMLLSLGWPVIDGLILLTGGQRDSEGRRLR